MIVGQTLERWTTRRGKQLGAVCDGHQSSPRPCKRTIVGRSAGPVSLTSMLVAPSPRSRTNRQAACRPPLLPSSVVHYRGKVGGQGPPATWRSATAGET
jgi:hypothetical protein